MAAGEVPAGVLATQTVFYRCGSCQQIFWPGDKYESTMEGLRADGKDEAGEGWKAEPARTGSGTEQGSGGADGQMGKP